MFKGNAGFQFLKVGGGESYILAKGFEGSNPGEGSGLQGVVASTEVSLYWGIEKEQARPVIDEG